MTTWALTKLVIILYWLSVWVALAVMGATLWACFRYWETLQIATRKHRGHYQL
jgi:hypothetical protein